MDEMLLKVGAPSPLGPAVEGMRIILEPGDEAPRLTLVLGIQSPTNREIRFLSNEPIRLGLLRHGNLMWAVLSSGDKLSFDAPYALGVETIKVAEEVRRSVALANAWPDTFRCLVTIVVVDSATGIVAALRVATLSKTWWTVAANILAEVSTSLTSAAYAAEIQKTYQVYATTPAMVSKATIMETIGRV